MLTAYRLTSDDSFYNRQPVLEFSELPLWEIPVFINLLTSKIAGNPIWRCYSFLNGKVIPWVVSVSKGWKYKYKIFLKYLFSGNVKQSRLIQT